MIHLNVDVDDNVDVDVDVDVANLCNVVDMLDHIQ